MMPPRATHTALAFLRSDGSNEHIRRAPGPGSPGSTFMSCDARGDDVTAGPNKLLRKSGESG
jgi:hypothetical protein